MVKKARNPAARLVRRIERSRELDRPGYELSRLTTNAAQLAGRGAKPVQNVLHGSWLGHPLHPALVTLPLGAWSVAFALDRGRELGWVENEDAAGSAIGIGLAGAAAAMTAGLADYRKVQGRERRTGLVHAAINTAATALHALSLVERRRGRPAAGRALSAAGWLASLAGGYLGGHLVYRRRIGVDHALRSPEPRAFVRVAWLDDLPEGAPVKVRIRDEGAQQDVPIALVREGGRVHALGARCSHLAGPLDKGWVRDRGLVCPWHGSRFCLSSGRVMDGPATAPQPCYQTEIRDGAVLLRRLPQPGDEAQGTGEAQSEPQERSGAEVLREHHDFIRALVAEIARLPADDPELPGLLKLVVSELFIHDTVEDKVYYPVVRRVTGEVPAARAEHQQLNEMAALCLRIGPEAADFPKRFAALRAGVEGHFRSEEDNMFRDARQLPARRRAALGRAVAQALEDERERRNRKGLLALKLKLIAGRS